MARGNSSASGADLALGENAPDPFEELAIRARAAIVGTPTTPDRARVADTQQFADMAS